MTIKIPVPIPLVEVLRQAGLTNDLLTIVLRRGEFERDNCTPFDAPAVPGFRAWGMQVRSLRELLVPTLGWGHDDSDGVSTVITPCGMHAVVPMSGDNGTGMEDCPSPQPKYPRGAAIAFAVERSQLSLFNSPNEPAQAATTTLWFLLSRRVRATATSSDTLYAELSRPKFITESGAVSAWHERHIIPPIELDGPPSFESRSPEAPIEIPTPRRRKG